MPCLSKCGLAIALAAGIALAQGPAAEDKPASVAGVVLNALTGVPVLRAHVVLWAMEGGKQQQYGAMTDAEGKFSIANLPAGSYRARAERVGFFLQRERNGGPGTEVVLSPGGEKRDLTLKLLPTGSISGRVLDAEGNPMEGVSVTVPGKGGTTDDQGRFRIGGLMPAKYRVKATPANLPLPPEVRTDGTTEAHYVPSYYPNSMEAKSASRVEVQAGEDLQGIEIRLVRMPIVRVSGAITGLPKGASASLELRQGLTSRGTRVKPDGTFEVWRLDPGKYSVAAYCNWSGQHLQTAPVEVEVGSSNVDHVELRIVPPSDISGQVEFDDQQAKGPQEHQMQRQLLFQETSTGASPPPVDVTDEGSFHVSGMQPGIYRVTPAWQPAYVKSLRLGPAEMNGNLLDLRNGSGGAPLSVVVSPATGEVSGTVTDESGPITGMRVWLAPAEEEIGSVTVSCVSGADGTYLIPNLAPGRYRLSAGERAEDGATLVEVRPGERAKQDLKP